MADNLIFPIGFDLEKGVKDVISRSDTYLRQIEHAMNRKPIVLRAEVDASKFQMFSRQFTNSIDGISAKLAQAQRLWNAMTFDVKFDADGNLSRRAQVVFDAFQQLTQASATMGQRLGEVNRNLAKSEQDTARAITAEYDKRRQQVNEQIRLKERQAATEERVRQGQLKGVNAGYVDIQRQVEAVRNLRLQYEAILPMLNAMAQRRYDIKVGIDKQFEADIQRINAEIARLRQSNLQLGAKGDTNAIQANLQAIRQLEAELQRISQQKIDLLNSNKINSDLARLRTEISSVFGELQSAERRLATDNSLNAALDAQSQKVLKLHADIQKLDQQFAQLNATGRAYNQDGSFTAQANTLLQQRIALTKQLEQEAITGQQAQIKLEQQLREEKRQTEQAAKNAAKEAERQAKAEAAARKQAQDAANAENKARQEAYNARRRQGQETQRILNKEAKSIADITAKLQIQQQRLQSANIGSAKFNKIAEEVKRLTADLEKANQKMRELTGQTQSGAARQSAAVKQVTNKFKHQDGYVSRLIKRLAVYASFSYASQFLTSIREVTAQFELQRVSLGAIIQDQQRANQLFSEIKAFALKSPVSILDLTKYTKQLAAYKIGVDELFDTTKRLTDVSVGLGVSMDRVVLAYGQVRATGYLRASEIRQFTEMGVPIVEELAAKLSKMNGELVTAADVMELVSKRGISFELVKEVFDDMTSAGGMFYNMQEKQGNTLFGLWVKLGDAASVMYDEIGNTESVNKGMKDLIELLTSLMRNWREVSQYIGYAGIAIAGLIVKKKILGIEVAKISAIQATYNARMMRANALASANSRLVRAQGVAMGVYAQSMRIASTTAAAFGTSLRAIKSALITTGWGALAVALGVIVDKLFLAKTNAQKAADAISQVVSDTVSETTKSVRNFEYLASKAVSAPKGSSEQKEALEELSRTYNKIIPQELLELEYLDKLNGKYGSLTKTIREYAAEQQKRQAIDEISNIYGPEKQKYERKLTDYFREQGWTKGEIARFWEKFYNVAKDKSKSLRQVVAESLQFAGRDGFEDMSKLLQSQLSLTKGLDKKAYNTLGITVLGGVDYVDVLRDAVLEENKALDQYEERQKAATSATNEFADAQEKAAERLKKVRFVDEKGEGINRDSYLGSQMLKNFEIKDMTDILKEGFAQAGLAWDNEYGNFINHINAKTPELISSLNFEAIINAIIEALNNPKLTEEQRQFLENLLSVAQQSKKRYEEIVPSDPVVRVAQTRFQQIAQSAGGFRQNYNQYLMKAGEDMESYNKRLKDSLEGLKNRVKALLATQKVIAKAGIFAKMIYGVSAEELQKDIDETNKTTSIIEKALSEQPDYSKSKSSKGTKSDPRLSILQEMVSTLKQVNKEYGDLAKKEGATKALADTQKVYAETFKNMQELATKYKFALPDFGVPTDTASLTKYLNAIREAMKKLPKSDKAVLALKVDIDKLDIDAQQKKIESELKRLADRISRTKTAKEFYEKILGMTGDYDLAANVSLSIYGDTGYDLQKQLAEQIRTYFDNDNIKVEIPVDVITPDNRINYKRLGEFAEQMKEKLGEEPYKAIKKIAEEGQKDLAKTYEGYLKDLEKAKTYADKRVELARTTAAKIRAINADIAAGNIDERVGKATIRGLQDREDREAAKLEYEAFKDTPLYVQMFEDLEHASTSTLEMMKSRLEALSGVWGTALDPTQLKEIQSRMNEIDTQLRERNPFKTLKESYQQYRDAVKSVSLQGATEKAGAASKDLFEKSKMYGADSAQALAAEKELKAREKIVEIARQINAENKKGQNALDEAAQIANDNLKIKRGELELASAQEQALRDKSTYEDPGQDPKVIAAHEAVEAAKEEVDLAERVAKITTNNAKTAKTLKENFAAAARQVTQFMGMAGDVAHAVADTMEALGGDEDDVQFWNDIGDAIGDLTAGFQGIIDSILSLNVAGIISNAIGIIPNMVKGFFGLFSAGKVRKANKEIKRQQELLEQLEYTYGRLEKVADKVFGVDFVSNMNQQRRLLLAQEQAYMKQYEAEMSKGKKADEEKAQEYLNQARDARDKIADMEGQIAERMTGTDVASAARDFAQAWLEAYASFGSTTDAIKEKFNDMIKNMIVESIMARTVQMALQPMFDKMDEMYESGASMTDVLGYAFSQAGTLTQQITDGLSVNAQQLEAMGIDIREMYATSDNLKGISKNIASASSEEILQLSGFVNTALYYISPIPRMDENLAQIRAIMERGVTPALSAGTTVATQDYTSILTTANEHLSSLPRMEQHLAEIHTMLGRALRTKGATTGFNTFLNS